MVLYKLKQCYLAALRLLWGGETMVSINWSVRHGLVYFFATLRVSCNVGRGGGGEGGGSGDKFKRHLLSPRELPQYIRTP